MSDKPDQTEPNGSEKKWSAFAFPLAFVPSLLLVGFFSFFARGNPPAILLAILCLISIVCCFVSSYLLFQRNKVLVTIFGVIFVLLNGLISFFFGCATILTNANFR
jgi:sugar phosphate permease